MGNKALSSLVTACVLVLGSATAALGQGSGPITQPDFAELAEDTLAVLYPLLNDTDPQGAGLALIAVSTPPTGSVRTDGPAVVFTPDPDWNGELELTYTVRSAGGDATGEIFITVNPVNDAPAAGDDSATIAGGQTVTIDALANDVDVDGDTLAIGAVNNPLHGSVSVKSGSIEYSATGDFTGKDTFTYTVFDPAGASSVGVVTVTVTAPAPTTTVVATTNPPSTTTAAPPTTAPPASTTAAPPTTVAPATTAVPTTVVTASSAPPATLAAGPTLVPSPGWEAPQAATNSSTDAERAGFVATLWRSLRSLAWPLALLALVGLTAWIMSQRGRTPGRKYAVVLVARDESLPVREKPDGSSGVVHVYEYGVRQLDVVERKRTVSGVVWLPVSTPGGRGWVDSTYLTEDVARTTFESDMIKNDVVRELRRKLKEGSTINCSPRGAIDPETFTRDPARRQLGGHATAKLAALIGDWRASFHVDQAASLAALRPPELRNLHWVSFEAPGLDPWQLLFEYHDGQPYPVAAMPENVLAPV